MKRLNFDQLKAEKSSMQRFDPFFTLVLFIFSTLIIAYFAFDYHLSGITTEKQKVSTLENKIQKLQLSNEALKLQLCSDSATVGNSAGRNIASLLGKKEISFDELYKSQLQTAVRSQSVKDILALTQKILTTSANADLLAWTLYEQSQVSCQLKPNEEHCFSDIETLVVQFPESKWAGESLVNLSKIYMKLKKFSEAASVIKIVKSEFPKAHDLARRINEIEKNKL